MMPPRSAGAGELHGRFPKREHILKTGEFRQAYKKGRSFRRDAFVLYCAPNGLDRRRIGFSISAKNIKSAARRNRVRRVFREVYRRTKDGLAAGIDLVLVVRKDPGKKFSYADCEKTFNIMTKGLGIS